MLFTPIEINSIYGGIIFNGSVVEGGVIDNRGVLTLTNSTVSNNEVNGIIVEGGGIHNGGVMTLTNSTISDNEVSGTLDRGGGIFNSKGMTLTLINNIVAGNTAPYGREVFNNGRVNADNYNLFGDSSKTDTKAFSGTVGFAPTGTDINATKDGTKNTPLRDILEPLADNGGPTETCALVPGSPALDYIPSEACEVAADQRGFTRPADGDGDGEALCDIGAYERGAGPVVGGHTEPASVLALSWRYLLVIAMGVATIIIVALLRKQTSGC